MRVIRFGGSNAALRRFRKQLERLGLNKRYRVVRVAARGLNDKFFKTATTTTIINDFPPLNRI